MKITLTLLIAAFVLTCIMLVKSTSPTGLLRIAGEERATALEEAQALWDQ